MSETPKGRLKMYLGYAAGVGKTYRMLEEAQELRKKGVDVVVGYFEPHGRKETIALIDGFEVIPRRVIPYAGSQFDEMDTDAIVHRHPQVTLVDEFAHTNVPSSPRLKRWQDVKVLLEAGIHVYTTMNIQHLESLNDAVWHITGVRVRETVPDWVVDEADEVVLVDLTPRALRNRLDRGVVYGTDKARQAKEKFFTESNLAALRELAMRHCAHEVEEKLHGAASPAPAEVAPARHELILICLTGSPTSAILIRRGKRVADYLQGDCLALHVAPPGDGNRDAADREAVERHLKFARNLRIETYVIEGVDVPRAITEFAHQRGATQVFMGRSGPRPWWKRVRQTLVQRVVRESRDIQITIVAERRR